MILTHPTLKRLTGPNWLMQMFNGFVNENKTATIEIEIDPNGTPIISCNILKDPDFNVDIEIINPETGKPTTPRAELVEIPYVYLEEEEIE